jgi:hypothetical protein
LSAGRKYSSPFSSDGGSFWSGDLKSSVKPPLLSHSVRNESSGWHRAMASARRAPFRPPALVPEITSTLASEPVRSSNSP